MEHFFKNFASNQVEGRLVPHAINEIVKGVRYLDGLSIKVTADGVSKEGLGTRDGLTYRIDAKWLEDCATY